MKRNFYIYHSRKAQRTETKSNNEKREKIKQAWKENPRKEKGGARRKAATGELNKGVKQSAARLRERESVRIEQERRNRRGAGERVERGS